MGSSYRYVGEKAEALLPIQSKKKVSDRRSFSGSLRFSIVAFLRSGQSGDPPLHHTLPEPAVTVEEDDGVFTDNSSGSSADSGNFKIWTPEMGSSTLDASGSYPLREDARA
ncbi:hypothetical protein EVAR_16206_1 [Eumeta japonica]|uniref:Uncharacterized protein n=1 Tax=Eumeta variegata TaxID=151549 RepID=A0A4C1U5W9_EUMVA|nr:hypothetical protein EVAR_16206_1 [Eumeta japonica]